MYVDLKARRCPDAQVLVNRLLEAFSLSHEPNLVIQSIEPSLVRNINGRIAGMDLKLKITTVEERPINATDISSWSEDYDEEDFGDVQCIQTIAIERGED